MPESKGLPLWLPLLLGLIGLVMVGLATAPHGAGVTSDTASYFAVADHLLEGEGFTRYDGEAYTSWPPLFPLLITGTQVLGLENATAARWINALVFGLIIFVASRWSLRHLESRFLGVTASLLFLFAYPILRVSLMAWTEPLFVLLSTIFLILLSQDPRERKSSHFAWLVITASLAWLDRYVGITLVGTGFIMLLLEKEDGFVRNLGRAVLFGFLSTLLPLAWIIRNLALTGAPAGERSPSTFSFIFNLQSAIKQTGWWIIPERLGGMISTLGLLAIVLLLVWVSLRWRRGGEGPRRDLRVFALFSAIYLSFLLYTSSRYAFEVIHSRYLIPLYPPLFFLLFRSLDPMLSQAKKSFAARVIMLLMSVWLLYPAAQSAVIVKQARAEGLINYSRDSWRASDLAMKMAESPPEGLCFSNQSEALYILAGVEAHRSPRTTYHPTSQTPTGELDSFAEYLMGDEPVFLIWFDAVSPHPHRRNFHTLEDIAARYHMFEIQRCEDGTLFQILPLPLGGNVH